MTEDNDLHQQEPHSQLFTVRLWRDTGQNDDQVPYMQVKHVLSGETRYFTAWVPLIDFMLGKLDALRGRHEPT